MFSSNNKGLQDEKKSSSLIVHQFIEEEKNSDKEFLNRLILDLEKEAHANNIDKNIAQQVCQKLKDTGSLHDIVSVVMLLLTIKKCTHQIEAGTVDELRTQLIAGAEDFNAIHDVYNQMETEILLQSASSHGEIDDEACEEIPLESLPLPNVFTPNIFTQPAAPKKVEVAPEASSSSCAPASVTHIMNQLPHTLSTFFLPANRAPQQTSPAAGQSDGMLRRYRGVNVSR